MNPKTRNQVREGVLRTLAELQALPCFREYLEEVRAAGEGEARVLGEEEGRAERARNAGIARLERELARLGAFARQEVETGVLELGAEVWELPGKEGVGGASRWLSSLWSAARRRRTRRFRT